ncbi:MAG: Asp-tRNA(Asn)/Glu-tRNA(Gln) amidotransferase subunit GatB [Simkaniaceae bacterium]|nr:Asp-tRNA(Asn)/Glu-tRNA(Gln) amidotransferase subunit GatB [Simkaniaceae bacterium]
MDLDHIYENWQPVIGLEIHTQLNTRTKMYSRAANAFGCEPNTNIGIVDTGQPGSLPVVNREAVRKAIVFGLAVGAKIAPYSRFDRKSYFYPDNPRNYQVTQFDHPIVIGGEVETELGTFQIEHAHLEDDSGMLKHFNTFAGVDYNRAGVPLIEIVSMPCMHSPKDAVAYATSIKAILEYAGVSDCNMEEGGLRMDVNISVRKHGEKGFRNRIEIKNMNSFTNMELAIEAEIKRQVQEYTAHPDKRPEEIIAQGTYRYDLESNRTVMLRAKESSEDYRYFPEPDLPPIFLTNEYIEEVRSNLPELPRSRYKRYIEQYELSEYNARLLINDKALCDQYEEGLKHAKNAKMLCNWLTVEFVGRYKELGKPIEVSIQNIAELVNLIDTKVINGKIAKKIADIMIAHPEKKPQAIVDENPDFKPIDDLSSIEPIVDQVLADNPSSITDFKAGKDKAFQYLVGQVMKATRGKANPEIVRDLITKKIGD